MPAAIDLPNSNFCLVDGEPAASIDVRDRGLAFGDGVFRTLRVRAGRALNWACHAERLSADCAAIGLPAPDPVLLREEVRRIAPADAAVKVIVTRGTAGRGYAPPGQPAPTRIVAAFEAAQEPVEALRTGVRVRRCALVLSEQPRLAGVKTLNRLENVLARSEWSDPDIREGLLCDAGGRLIEATASNVFLVRQGRLETPLLARCGVTGAQRQRVLALAARQGYECAERDIAFAELAEADEVFLTNSLIGVLPVAACDGSLWEAGPVARQLQGLLAEEDARAA